MPHAEKVYKSKVSAIMSWIVESGGFINPESRFSVSTLAYLKQFRLKLQDIAWLICTASGEYNSSLSAVCKGE